MAVSSGVGPHFAWVLVEGMQFPIVSGSAEQAATRKSSTFSAVLPLSFPGAEDTFSQLGQNQASVMVSTRGEQATLLSGEIDTVKIDYVARTISVTGRDQSAMLHGTKSSEKFINQMNTDVVKTLASRVGLTVQADPSMVQAGKMVQIDYAKMTDGVSYAAVIHKLAEMDGARWFVRNGMLFYLSMDDPQGTYTLNYVPPTQGNPMMGDFLALDISRNIQAGKTLNVTVKSWHPKKATVFTSTSTIQGSGGPQNYIYHVPNHLQDHVTQFAKSKAAEVARHELTVNAEVVGDPTIDIAMDLVVNGTDIFDQSYKMDLIHHTFGYGGHTMRITAKSMKAGRSSAPSGGA
jgi:hypothetical protein